jgi:glycosyltransferase involved in cell wall biosynthesis
MKKKVVIHFASTMGFGGVQTGIVKSMAELNEQFDYHVLSLGEMNEKLLSHLPTDIAKKVHFIGSRFFYLGWLSCIPKIAALKPDVVVVSLWKSIPPSLVFKILNPKIPLVAFYHSVKPVHFADRFFQWLLARFQTKTFTDSEITSTSIERRFGISNAVVIPYHFSQDRSWVKVPEKTFELPFRFVYFGRLTKEKGIWRAIDFCELLKSLGLLFEFHLYAPSPSADLLERLQTSAVAELITLKETVSPLEVSKKMLEYDFLLQLSDFEGMGLAVVEAMKNGLIPLVTQVGEMANYCTHGENGFLLKPPFEANMVPLANELLDAVENKTLLNAIRTNCINTFADEADYVTVFSEQIRQLLAE